MLNFTIKIQHRLIVFIFPQVSLILYNKFIRILCYSVKYHKSSFDKYVYICIILCSNCYGGKFPKKFGKYCVYTLFLIFYFSDLYLSILFKTCILSMKEYDCCQNINIKGCTCMFLWL